MTPLIFTHYICTPDFIAWHLHMTLYIILSIIIVYNYAILHNIIQLALEAPSGRANNVRGHIQHSSCLSNHFYL